MTDNWQVKEKIPNDFLMPAHQELNMSDQGWRIFRNLNLLSYETSGFEVFNDSATGNFRISIDGIQFTFPSEIPYPTRYRAIINGGKLYDFH